MGLFNYDLTNPQTSIEWMIYLTSKYLKMFLDGTWLTLYIAVLGTIFGFILGYIVGIVQDTKTGLGDNIFKKSLVRLMKIISATYVEVFRDTPMIVQAMIIYYGIRQLGVDMAPVFAGILVTTLNTGAYMAEAVSDRSISDREKAPGQWVCHP